MPKTSLAWKTNNVSNAFSAQIAKVTYHVASGVYGHSAYVEVHSRRGLKRLDLGLYVKPEQAQQACERHRKLR
jgi:hypothetical protein